MWGLRDLRNEQDSHDVCTFFFLLLLLLEAKFYWREIDYLMVVRKVFAAYIWLIEVSMRNQKCH